MFRFRRIIARTRRLGAVVALVPAGTFLLATSLPAQVASRVRVEIREAGTGRSLPDVEIEIVGAAETAWTGEDGRAVLRGLPSGRQTLRSRHPGFVPAEVVVEVANGRTIEVLLRLQPRAVELEGVDVEVQGLPRGARAIALEEVGAEVRSLAGMVESLPGVTVVRRGGPGASAVPTIRGSSGDQVLVLVDGVALNSPLTGEADLSEVDLAHAARVVVIPGARAGRFGPRAMAGVILIETRSPRSSTATSRLEVGTLGTWGLGASASLARRDGDWTLSAGGEWNRSAGAFEYPVPAVRGGGFTTRENAQVRVLSGFVQGAWNPVDGPRFRLRLHARDAERGSPGTIVQPSLTGRHEQRRTGLLFQTDGGGAAAGWQVMVGGDEHRALFADPAPPFGAAFRSESRVRQIEARGEARHPIGPVAFSAGSDGRYRGIEANTLAEGAPDGVGGAGVWVRGRWEGGRPGGRSMDVAGTIRADAHDLLDGIVASPSFSIVLRDGATSLEAVVGSVVSPPDISDLFFEEGVLTRANPQLAPERVRGEVSLELRRGFAGEAWEGSLGLGAFRADVDGMILWFPDHRFVWSPENLDVRRRGVEATGELRWGLLSPLRANASWTEVAYDEAVLDGQVVYRPRLTADLQATMKLPGVNGSARWYYVGARRTRPGTDLNDLDGYHRLDLGMAAPFRIASVRGAVEMGVNNVLNEAAALLVDYPLPGRTFSLRLRLGS